MAARPLAPATTGAATMNLTASALISVVTAAAFTAPGAPGRQRVIQHGQHLEDTRVIASVGIKF